jgi:hypothetical protein
MSGIGRGTDLPTGSVLDRVKMFLPVIAAANDELQQKILNEGPQSVQIDSHLHQPEPPVSSEDKMDTVEDPEIEDISDNDEIVADNNSEQKIEKVVELNFALGDFDQSNIALLEELGKEDNEEDSNNNKDEDDDA